MKKEDLGRTFVAMVAGIITVFCVGCGSEPQTLPLPTPSGFVMELGSEKEDLNLDDDNTENGTLAETTVAPSDEGLGDLPLDSSAGDGGGDGDTGEKEDNQTLEEFENIANSDEGDLALDPDEEDYKPASPEITPTVTAEEIGSAVVLTEAPTQVPTEAPEFTESSSEPEVTKAPAPTSTPVPTPSPAPVPTPTEAPSPTPPRTVTPTVVPTVTAPPKTTPTPKATATPKPKKEATPTPTPTEKPKATPTEKPSNSSKKDPTGLKVGEYTGEKIVGIRISGFCVDGPLDAELNGAKDLRRDYMDAEWEALLATNQKYVLVVHHKIGDTFHAYYDGLERDATYTFDKDTDSFTLVAWGKISDSEIKKSYSKKPVIYVPESGDAVKVYLDGVLYTKKTYTLADRCSSHKEAVTRLPGGGTTIK